MNGENRRLHVSLVKTPKKPSVLQAVLVKIVTEILFWQCNFGEAMKQPSWQQITDQRTSKKRQRPRPRVNRLIWKVGLTNSKVSTLYQDCSLTSVSYPNDLKVSRKLIDVTNISICTENGPQNQSMCRDSTRFFFWVGKISQIVLVVGTGFWTSILSPVFWAGLSQITGFWTNRILAAVPVLKSRLND